jgi:DNA-binding beta-propeller fold protein YncE
VDGEAPIGAATAAVARHALAALGGALTAAALIAPAGAHASEPEGLPKGTPGARDVVMVANAEGGTVSVVDARRLRVLREIDVLPDGRETTFEDDPVHAVAGQQLVQAAGGDNFAQDVDVSPDGRTLYVSRGHRGDVAAFDIATGRLEWKLRIPGLRSDHMTISGDGRRLYVSALTEDEVEVVDTRERRIVASIPSGQWPHDNHVSADGRRLYNGSIGNIVAPAEARGTAANPPYRLTIADAETHAPLATHVFERGIRPYVITHDESRLYAQLSELHGLVEFDLREGRVLRTRELPIDAGVTEDDYDFEAPHHGLALSHDERTLCAAGRASDYVALVSTATFAPTAIIDVADGPGWATTGPGGRSCFVANTRADSLSVVSFARRREVARLAMGDGPKQIEAARLPASVLCTEPAGPGCGPAPKLRLRARCRANGGLHLRLRGDVDAVRRVTFRAGGRILARDAGAPFAHTIGRRTLSRMKARRARAVAVLTRGPSPRAALSGALRRCRF